MRLGKNLLKLMSIGKRPSEGRADARVPELLTGRLGDARAQELLGMLEHMAGLYAFESALLIRPLHSLANETGIAEWNAPDGWQSAYADFPVGCVCFAEDIFGGQFALQESGVCAFDPETGEIKHLTDSLERWAELILGDYEYLTGYPLGHEWQVLNGPLARGYRLVPIKPFVLEGPFDVLNLMPMESRRSMVLRAKLAHSIRDLPDGAAICWP